MKNIWFNQNLVVTVCDLPDQQVVVNGKVWRFDYDKHFGPLWLTKQGNERRCQNPNKAVWAAFEEWQKTQNE